MPSPLMLHFCLEKLLVFCCHVVDFSAAVVFYEVLASQISVSYPKKVSYLKKVFVIGKQITTVVTIYILVMLS